MHNQIIFHFQKYFQDRCIGGCKSSNVWSTIKPYLSKKSRDSKNKIILNENDKIISNNEEVADIFNDYFVNVADWIGKHYVFNHSDHPSLRMIDAKHFEKDAFEFKPTDQETVSKLINKFNHKKAQVLKKYLSKYWSL